ncbi:Cys/Met metabolism PLP-dependent enzyme-domain-containing protein [Mucidula mucida]|nr:Cys/Met metabolism PLP-dependent enzyme-domain-containing protein [Mucidula mucida]
MDNSVKLQGGQVPDSATRARAPPIYASAGFTFKNSLHGAELFEFKAKGNVYSRMANPTIEVFEERIAALEGGVAAVATSSGMAAEFMALATICRLGDNVVCPTFLFGGTYNLFKVTLPKFGINVKFVPSVKAEDLEAAIDDRTRAVYVETMSNPNYDVADIPAISKMAHAHGIPLVVDNTFGAGGYYSRPFEHGADVTTHSASKWIGGHGNVIAGVVVDSGRFDWSRHASKFPHFTEPNDGYHGLVFTEHFRGKGVLAAKMRLELMRDVGLTMSPFSGWLLIQGLETLSLRAQRHSDNALALARYLKGHEKVTWVVFPGLEEHPEHELAKKLFRKDTWGAMLSFGVKPRMEGGLEMDMGARVVDCMKLATNMANVGDSKTLVINPATTTHQQLTEEERRGAGVTSDMIRVSVGIEDVEDIIHDFMSALEVAFS